MINFLRETIDAIEKSKHWVSDIVFIGTDDGKRRCSTWDDFTRISNFEYIPDYGSSEIIETLVIIFNDNDRLIRSSEFGSEHWLHISKIPKIATIEELETVRIPV
jgi:hypothetical protein